MAGNLEILHSPSQWQTIAPERLRTSACVVVDVIRATSTIAAAIAAGASGVRPVANLDEAFALKAKSPKTILAGERGGKMVEGFDFGNSPEDFTEEKIKRLPMILTTTNGTQALAACVGARAVLTVSFLNLSAVAARLKQLGPPWTIVCAGCNGEFGMDDAIVAGALAEAMDEYHSYVSIYRSVRSDLAGALRKSAAGQELVKVGLGKDIPFCAKLDLFSVVPALGTDGVLRNSA